MAHRLTARVCLAIAALAWRTGAPAAILGVLDAETGNLGQANMTQSCCADSLTVVRSPVRAGAYAVKSYVRATDTPVATHRRAEVSLGGSVTGEYWYGWSLYFPTGFNPDTNYHLVTQWHTVSPIMQPLQLNVQGTKWRWVNFIGVNGSAPNVLWEEDFTPNKGQWIDWVVHVNWSSGADGFIHIWKNGKQIVNRAGPVTYQGSAEYWKVGLVYDTAQTLTLYLDELRMGDARSSYAEVAPRSASSLPTSPIGLRLAL